MNGEGKEMGVIRNIRDDCGAAAGLEEMAARLRRNEEVEFIFAARIRKPGAGHDHEVHSTWHTTGSSTITVLGLLQHMIHRVQMYIEEE